MKSHGIIYLSNIREYGHMAVSECQESNGRRSMPGLTRSLCLALWETLQETRLGKIMA